MMINSGVVTILLFYINSYADRVQDDTDGSGNQKLAQFR